MSAENGRSRCFSILILSVVRPLPGEPRQAVANPLPGEPRQAHVRRAFTRPQTKVLSHSAQHALAPSIFQEKLLSFLSLANVTLQGNEFGRRYSGTGHFGSVAGVALPFIVALTAATFVFFVFSWECEPLLQSPLVGKPRFQGSL